MQLRVVSRRGQRDAVQVNLDIEAGTSCQRGPIWPMVTVAPPLAQRS
jgi:hypothetical protein